MLTKIRRNVVAGILTAIPILVTVWVISFLVGLLVALGSPFVRAYVDWLKIHSPTLAEGLPRHGFKGRFQSRSSSLLCTSLARLRPPSPDGACSPRSTT